MHFASHTSSVESHAFLASLGDAARDEPDLLTRHLWNAHPRLDELRPWQDSAGQRTSYVRAPPF